MEESAQEPPLQDRILALLADYLDVPVDELTPQTTLAELEIDSLDFLEIMFEVEEELGIEIPDDAADLKERLRTLDDVIVLASEIQSEPA